MALEDCEKQYIYGRHKCCFSVYVLSISYVGLLGLDLLVGDVTRKALHGVNSLCVIVLTNRSLMDVNINPSIHFEKMVIIFQWKEDITSRMPLYRGG